MLSKFEDLKISIKLVVAFLAVAAVGGAVGLVGVVNIQKMKLADTYLYEQVAVPLGDLREITQAFLMNRIVTRALIAAADADEREEIADTIKENIATLAAKTAAYEKRVAGAGEKTAYVEFKKGYDAYMPLLDRILELSLSGKTEEALEIAKGDATKQANLMLRALDKLSQQTVKQAKETAERNSKVAATALQISVALAVLIVLAAIAIGVFVAYRISRPLERLRLEAEQVSAGNLAVQIDKHCDDELGQLSASFSVMVDNLRDLIARVSETALSVSKATQELYAASEQIAGGAETAAGQTVTVATASEEMAATSHDIAGNCQLAVEGAKRANRTAQSGAEVVRQTVEGMQKIALRVRSTAQTVDSLGARSDQIGAIVATIEDIAEQTNLLALNAAIEAARAGEMGRGFAVVADEVRALAERTTRATREIGEMIKAIQSETRTAVSAMDEGVREVESGTRDAERSGAALEQILSEIDAVADQVHQIAVAAAQQSATTGNITDNIQQMTQIIQETAKGSHQTAASASNLSTMAEALERIVTRFRLR